MPDDKSAILFQATGTALTATYALAGNEQLVDGATTCYAHLYWTKGDETSIELKAEFALRSGGTQAQEVSTSTLAGVSTVTIREYTFSTATDNVIIPIRIQGRYVNIFIKASGGTPTGTYGMGIHLMRE